MEYSGNISDFAKLYEEIYRDLYKTAYYMLGNSQDAEDAVSDTVLDAYRGIGKLRDNSLFKHWIYKILCNKCKRKMREYVNRTLPLEENSKVIYTNIDELHDIRIAFMELEKQERMIVALHVFGGYKSHETAEILDMNPNTVRSKYSRAIEKMEKKLEVWI